MITALRRRRWTKLISLGLGAYVTAMAILVVVLSGDVANARRGFFATAALGATFLAAAIVLVRRRRPRPSRSAPGHRLAHPGR